MQKKTLLVVMDEREMDKFDYIARYYCRTRRKHILALIDEVILNFEREHGEINVSTKSESER